MKYLKKISLFLLFSLTSFSYGHSKYGIEEFFKNLSEDEKTFYSAVYLEKKLELMSAYSVRDPFRVDSDNLPDYSYVIPIIDQVLQKYEDHSFDFGKYNQKTYVLLSAIRNLLLVNDLRKANPYFLQLQNLVQQVIEQSYETLGVQSKITAEISYIASFDGEGKIIREDTKEYKKIVSVFEKINKKSEISIKAIILINDWAINAYSNYQVLRFNIGLLEVFQSEQELACTIGHELAHTKLNHIQKKKDVRHYNRNLGYLPFYNEKHLNAKYSQINELEADFYGMLWVYQAYGVDPYVCVIAESIMFTKIVAPKYLGQQEFKEKTKDDILLSSHPEHKFRLKMLREFSRLIKKGVTVFPRKDLE